jgi:catechol 2,3-dioxygenase-like lactoylglutathione lyase family enzyme
VHDPTIASTSQGRVAAGHALFVDDYDARLGRIAGRGLEPAEVETYDNGVRKAVFRDPDGNEIGFGGAATPTRTPP